MTQLYERSFKIPIIKNHKNLISYFDQAISHLLSKDEIPIRFVVHSTDSQHYHCEVGILKIDQQHFHKTIPSIFSFEKRKIQRTDQFNIVLMVPTGIGAQIGGHAGDACPVSKMLGSLSDHIITHPNVVNASDINELPENGLYVEGSTLSRLLMGSIALEKTRSNELLFAIDKHSETSVTNSYINSLNAARSVYGLECPQMIEIEPPLEMVAEYSENGRAVGRVSQLSNLIELLDSRLGSFDAIALATIIQYPPLLGEKYFQSQGEMINPWGGVEAIFTHALSLLYDIPCAHAPMIRAEDLKEQSGLCEHIVDPRMAGEVISMTFSQCIFKGLQKSPRMISDPEAMRRPGLVTAEDISCLIVPEGCLGLPVLAALEQGIPVIAVKENQNLMRNDLSQLPWRPRHYYLVENYWEAAGVIAALKAGISPSSVRRPLQEIHLQ